MIAEEPTRIVTKRLRKAGWAPTRTVGSHSTWECSTGKHTYPLPDGHKMISPGVLRNLNKAVAACGCGK